jgi:hypothetical protein
MKSIRIGVFETNSSSTHSLTICSKAEFEAWQSGELVFAEYKKKFYTMAEVLEKEKDNLAKDSVDVTDADELSDWLKDNEYKLNGDYESEYLESFKHHYTSESGDEIVIFGVYGIDD